MQQPRDVSQPTQNRVGEGRDDEVVEEIVYTRARPGQATNPHSLLERDRRMRINEAIDMLQSVIPNGSEIGNEASIYDRAYEYIRFLQTKAMELTQQVEALEALYGNNTINDTGFVDYEHATNKRNS